MRRSAILDVLRGRASLLTGKEDRKFDPGQGGKRQIRSCADSTSGT
jgi:hypothetical protein